MFQQVNNVISTPNPATNDQDELIERRKLEQKRRFQQKQGNAHTNVDSLMQSMFSDLKLQSKSNTSVSQIIGSVSQPAPTHAAVPGAADWSKIAFDDELNTIFHHEEKTNHIPTINSEQPSFVYPTWCLQSIVSLPLVYQQVLEASCLSGVIQTPVLYPILLLSGLKQDQLSQIWSQVNLTHPGILTKEELFMALALIALAQNSSGHIYSNNDLYHLTDVPIPHFQIQQPPPPVYHQEDFADFTSFDDIVQDNNNSTNKVISSETQSIASLDLPMPTLNSLNQDDTSQRGFSDNISFTSSNNNENQAVPDTLSEPSKLELTQFSFFSDDTLENDSHVSVWLRCFEKCHSILSQANEIFSSIHSPALCTEVLQQTRTREYVYHLQEIFHVHKRIYTAAIPEPTTTAQLTSLWKQIVVLWTNLQSFFSTAHLHLLNDDDIDYSSLLSSDTSSYCSICLLSTVSLEKVLPSSSFSSLNTACLTFAGRLYHAACANFYLNLIDGILPSLRRSS